MAEESQQQQQQPLVELLEIFGSDLTVVNAARVSFAKESKQFDKRDEKLLSYLARHHHVSPFFHPQARFRMKMPIFVAREWFRHTVGFARNEVSRRYVDSPPECWIPPAESIRARDPKAKQGSRPNPVENSDIAHRIMANTINDALEAYDRLLSHGVAPEVARAILPQSMYTEFIETASLAAYARLCALRLDPTAQKEIQEYARMISVHMEKAFPASWKALAEQWESSQTTAPGAAVAPTAVPVPQPNQPQTTSEEIKHSPNLHYWGC